MKENKDLELNLPDWSGHPPEPKVTSIEMIKICEAMLPYWNKLRFENPPPLIEGRFVLEDCLSFI